MGKRGTAALWVIACSGPLLVVATGRARAGDQAPPSGRSSDTGEPLPERRLRSLRPAVGRTHPQPSPATPHRLALPRLRPASALTITFYGYARLALYGDVELPLGVAVAWVSNWEWALGVLPLVTVGVLLFPDGRLPGAGRRYPSVWAGPGRCRADDRLDRLCPGTAEQRAGRRQPRRDPLVERDVLRPRGNGPDTLPDRVRRGCGGHSLALASGARGRAGPVVPGLPSPSCSSCARSRCRCRRCCRAGSPWSRCPWFPSPSRSRSCAGTSTASRSSCAGRSCMRRSPPSCSWCTPQRWSPSEPCSRGAPTRRSPSWRRRWSPSPSRRRESVSSEPRTGCCTETEVLRLGPRERGTPAGPRPRHVHGPRRGGGDSRILAASAVCARGRDRAGRGSAPVSRVGNPRSRPPRGSAELLGRAGRSPERHPSHSKGPCSAPPTCACSTISGGRSAWPPMPCCSARPSSVRV